MVFQRHWLKVSISLTVVMGITWIIGVLVIEVEELFALAYIFTISVAFQGLFIFVIFVPLSKQVRENYLKWWKARVAESDILSSYFGDKRLIQGTSGSVSKRILFTYCITGFSKSFCLQSTSNRNTSVLGYSQQKSGESFITGSSH